MDISKTALDVPGPTTSLVSHDLPCTVQVDVRDPQLLHAVLEGLSGLGLKPIIGLRAEEASVGATVAVIELPQGFMDLLALPMTAHFARTLGVIRAKDMECLEGGVLRGIDDFIVSPWGEREFRIRLKRLMEMGPKSTSAEITLGPLTLQIARRVVLVNGRPVKVTKTQFSLLAYLVANADRVVSRRELMERFWGSQHGGSATLIGTHMHGLRRKLGPAAGVIVTVRGVGYMATGNSLP